MIGKDYKSNGYKTKEQLEEEAKDDAQKKKEAAKKQEMAETHSMLRLNTETEIEQHAAVNSPTESERAIIKTLKDVPEQYESDRHRGLKSELKIRMLLAKEQVKFAKEEHYQQRQEELKELYETYKALVVS